MQQSRYSAFCQNAPDLPIYLEPWYLDAVCEGGQWFAVFVEKGGRDVAVLPFFLKQKLWWKYVSMPRLCKFLGPYLVPEYRNAHDETEIYSALLEQLPQNLAAFEQDNNYEVRNWLPYYWKGFRQTTRYSYCLNLSLSEAQLWNQISKSYKNKIRKAGRQLVVTANLPLSALYGLLRKSYERQQLPMPYSADFLEKLYQALQSRQCVRLFFARDPVNQSLHAGSMLVWDKHSAYYLVSGNDPALRQSGAAVLLQWEAILFAKNELSLPLFDFEGSMMPNIEPGRRAFGAVQTPYFRLQKEWSPLWKLGKWLWR